MNIGIKRFLQLVSILISLIVGIPLYMIVINAMKNSNEAADLTLSFPKSWHLLPNFKEIYFAADLPSAFWNTMVVTVIGVALIVLVSCMSAYVIQRRNTRMSKVLEALMIFGMILPQSVIMTYFLLISLDLIRTFTGVILIYTATNYALFVFLYNGFFYGIPRELDEAAIIDGAGKYRLFFQIIFPLLKPITATVIIISSMNIWNDFATAFYFLNTATRFTLSLTVYFFFSQHSSDWNLVFMDLLIISFPIVVLYIFFQKYIVAGLTSGAVKG